MVTEMHVCISDGMHITPVYRSIHSVNMYKNSYKPNPIQKCINKSEIAKMGPDYNVIGPIPVLYRLLPEVRYANGVHLSAIWENTDMC